MDAPFYSIIEIAAAPFRLGHRYTWHKTARLSLCFDLLFSLQTSGRTGGVPVTIGIAPPPMLMAGRSHCLRRFFRARTVTERKFHYIQIFAAGPPPFVVRCPACGADGTRSFSVTLKNHPLPRKGKIMAHPPLGSLYAATRGMYPACPLFNFPGPMKNKNISLINLFIFGAKVSELRETFSKIFPCF